MSSTTQSAAEYLAGARPQDPAGWTNLYASSRTAGRSLSGYRHVNYVVRFDDDSRAVIRAPVNVDNHEPRMFEESEVLRVLQESDVAAPRLLYQSTAPAFQVHSFVQGEPADRTVHDASPAVVSALKDAIARLRTIGRSALGRDVGRHPWFGLEDGDSESFAKRLSRWLLQSLVEAPDTVHRFFKHLGVDPEAHLARNWSALTLLSSRPFRLCHGDSSPQNCLVWADRGTFIDWELSVWGDPAWDIASHLHRAGYQGDKYHIVKRALLNVAGSEERDVRRALVDIESLRQLEVLRSLILDCHRDLHLLQGCQNPEERGRTLALNYSRVARAAGLPAVRPRNIYGAYVRALSWAT